MFPTTIEQDQELLARSDALALTTNQRHAVITRLGEKLVLREYVRLEQRIDALYDPNQVRTYFLARLTVVQDFGESARRIAAEDRKPGAVDYPQRALLPMIQRASRIQHKPDVDHEKTEL